MAEFGIYQEATSTIPNANFKATETTAAVWPPSISHEPHLVAERVENVLGLAATTHNVDNWIWEKTYEQYIENKEIRDALTENNRFAMMDIVKNMLQAEKRGYWSASEENIENLKKLYLELEN